MSDMRDIIVDALRLHQAGHLDQAAARYSQVLKADPRNADALHLLGMIALQQNRFEQAVELTTAAVAIDPRQASYHFHLALARQSLNDLGGAIAGYRRALALDPKNPDIFNNMGNALAASGQPQDAIAAFGHALALAPGNALLHNNLGNAQQTMGLRDEAEASFRKAIALDPGYAGALVNLANLCRGKGDLREAEQSYCQALVLAPRETAALCGLGVTQWQLGRHGEAVATYGTALAIDPNHPETLVNLGIAREHAGALDEAERLYTRAHGACPNDPEILVHLGSVRLARGDGAGAMAAVLHALDLAETPPAKKLFADILRRWDVQNDARIRHLMTRALLEPWDRPGALGQSAARLIRADPAIAAMAARACAEWPAPIALSALLGADGFAPLTDPLLIALLVSTPNSDSALERLFTLLRGAMLRERPQGDDALAFAAALAQQCFLNEYVFACGADEAVAARALDMRQADAMPLLLAAAYGPLHSLAGAEHLLQRSWPPPVEAVLTQQLREPLREQALRAEIPRLTAITDPVSLQVRDQYEENPYPRWRRAAPETPDTIAHFLAGKFPGFQPPAAMRDILVAGCGTGQRAIALAQKFGAADILAVDLSLASLAYGKRKAQELGLDIAYAQADILELEGRAFDLIESLGVLHHLADPWEGWDRLLALLRPGGVMMLGLYSQAARRPVAALRRQIDEHGIRDIRAFRQTLIDDPAADPSILNSEDFFSLSACRDLLFHVQETPVTLAGIAGFLRMRNLRLLGFELPGAVLAAYCARFPGDAAATDLERWQAFEADHPGLFAGMYIFWVQKPI